MKIFFENLNDLKKLIDKKLKTFLKSEIISRRNARRSIFFNKDLKKNQKIRRDDLIMLRPAIGINPFEVNKKYIGKKIKRDLKKGEILKKNHF